MLNNLNTLFLILTFSSSILAISSSTWLSAWMALELNMISFIPLLVEEKNSSSNETALKYFLIQAMASSLFIVISITNTFFYLSFSILEESTFSFLMIPLLIKLGAAPFQAWFIMLMNKLNWWKALLLATWQKIAPLFILSYLNLNMILIVFMSILSLLFGSIGGLSQTTFQKIFAFSSLTHLGWLFSTFMVSSQLLFLYFFFYTIMNTILFFLMFFMNTFHFNQNLNLSKSPAFTTGILSLSGLPPFWGFIPKWMVIQHMIFINQFFIAFILILSALINLFFYLRLIILNSLLASSSLKWIFFIYSPQHKTFITLLSLLNILALLLFNLLIF